MNKSVMKCCICNNENIGEFITINDKKYHLCCIEQLQKENKQLKEHIEKYERYCKTTGIKELKENQKYKEVIDKAIKLIEDSYYSKNTTDIDSIVLSGDKLLQVRKILKEVE